MKKQVFSGDIKKDQSDPYSSRERINTRYIFPKAIVLFVSPWNIFSRKKEKEVQNESHH